MRVLEIILPVFVMLLLGMACRKWKLLTKSGIENMKMLVTNIMLPVAIFHALATADYSAETGKLVGIMFVMLVLSFGMGFLLGGVRVASGLLIVPLIIGIVWLFASGGSMGSKIMIGVGVLIIIAGVIASTTIRLQTITLYEWVIMLVLIFGGAGLLAKILLTNPEEDYGYHSRKKNRGNSYSDSIDKQIEEMKRRRK